MNADELILAMAREKARTFAIDLRTATVLVLEDPANSILAESYVSGSSAPSLRERQLTHLAAAMGKPVATAGVDVNTAIAEAARKLVAAGHFVTLSAAVRHLLADPAVALAYERGDDVLGVVGGEVHLSPHSRVPAGPRIACLPQHRHVTTGMAA